MVASLWLERWMRRMMIVSSDDDGDDDDHDNGYTRIIDPVTNPIIASSSKSPLTSFQTSFGSMPNLPTLIPQQFWTHR